jgi:dipeptidyl aminopeptidase/acylaminoacyl peptidase
MGHVPGRSPWPVHIETLAIVGALFFLLPGLSTRAVSAPQQGSAKQPPPSFEPEVAVQTEEYAKVRKDFRTKLLRRGPSPQQEPMPDPPSGVSAVEYPSGDLRLKAWINPSQRGDEKKRPAVLFLHGGASFNTGDWEMTKPYREAGYVVLAPMLRGENGQAGIYTLFYDEVDDVLAAGEFLKKQSYVDASRVFVAGHSVGGTLTLLAAEAATGFRAAASISGSPDQILYCRYAAKKERIPFDLSAPRELEVRSPLAYAKSLRCPTRIYYATQERHFEKTSKRMAAIAKEKGVDVEAVVVEGNHMTLVPEAMKQSIEFFEKQRK